MQQQAAAGNASGIMDLFRNGDQHELMRNPLVQNMQSGFFDNITSKFGINKNAATGLAATFIPLIISRLVNRTNSKETADNGFDPGSLLSGLAGGGGGHGFGNILNQFNGSLEGSGFAKSNLNQQTSNENEDKNSQGRLSTLIDDFLNR